MMVIAQRGKNHKLFKPIKHKSVQKTELSADVWMRHFKSLFIAWRVVARGYTTATTADAVDVFALTEDVVSPAFHLWSSGPVCCRVPTGIHRMRC